MSSTLHQQLSRQLICDFRVLHSSPPPWAWPFAPSIPFVGDWYRPGKGLFIYANAENLAGMRRQGIPKRFINERVWNRYRAVYEKEGRGSAAFFPEVGMAPVSNGALLTAGVFIAETLGLPTRRKPRTFLETLAVSNWCKFTILSKANVDYVSDVLKLTASLPFVVSELSLLRPRLVMLPKTIWKHRTLAAAMRGASPRTRFLAVTQFNSRVVNIHLGKYDRTARRLRRRNENTVLADWMQRVRGFREENAWRYLAMLDGTVGPSL